MHSCPTAIPHIGHCDLEDHPMHLAHRFLSSLLLTAFPAAPVAGKVQKKIGQAEKPVETP
jgi:hypothetical protein